MTEDRDWRAGALLGVGLLAVAVLLMYLGRHLSFFADEWSFALYRRSWNASALLDSHNGHLVLVPALIYKVLFEVVGFAHSWPYRLTLVLFHATCVVCIYLLARRRFGPWLALFPAGLLLLPGTSTDDMLSAFQIAFVGAMAFGLAALLCLDREERRFDIAATVMVGLSIACSTVGAAFAIGILAELALTRAKRPRLYVALIPFGLYALWFAGFHGGGDNALQGGNISGVPRYDARLAAQGFSGFGNLPLVLGVLLVLVTGAWLLRKLVRERGLPVRACVGIVGGGLFWTLTALTRGQIESAGAARYIYISMIFILIAVIPCLPPIRRVSWQVAVVLAAVVAFALVNDYSPLRSFANDYRAEQDGFTAAERGAEYISDHEGDPWNAAIRDLDYPVLSGPELMALPISEQLRADRTLTELDPIEYAVATPVEVERATPATLPASAGAHGGTITRAGLTCTRVTPADTGGVVDVRLPSTRDLLILRIGKRNPAIGVRVRRLSSQYQPGPVPIPPDALPAPGTAGVIRIVDDGSALPWYARLEMSAPVGLCLVPPLS